MDKKYRPSSGTEGESFISEYCMNCIHEKWLHDNNSKKKCNILSRSMMYDINEKQYPSEWQYQNGRPVCLNYVKWDWGNDGDPDDPDNPKAPIPYNPNQLVMPFLLDEIEDKKKLLTPALVSK